MYNSQVQKYMGGFLPYLQQRFSGLCPLSLHLFSPLASTLDWTSKPQGRSQGEEFPNLLAQIPFNSYPAAQRLGTRDLPAPCSDLGLARGPSGQNCGVGGRSLR